MACALQYKYEQNADKYTINCTNKKFEDFNNVDTFTNHNFLEFIEEKYGNSAFSDVESPFTFSADYIDETNNEICKTNKFSLKPQQKFAGQFMNPATNFNNTLIYHGLGSGKTCTSIIIGEAFKNATKTKLLYVVPAPLVNQVTEEIIGQLKEYSNGEQKRPVIWGCTSECIISGKPVTYTSPISKKNLTIAEKEYTQLSDKKSQLSIEITKVKNEEPQNAQRVTTLEKEFKLLEQKVLQSKNKVNNLREMINSAVYKRFEITSHVKFLNQLFTVNKDGSWKKGKYLLDKNSPLLNKDGLLVIDEIQRLVSEGGIFYKKLFSAIYQYMHSDARIVLLSATPIYDNPYELALTMNLLRPRIPFPLTKEKFYSFFIGKYNNETEECTADDSKKNFITESSCVINPDLLRMLCAGYISYFKGGNPNAYPYKRTITLEHIMPAYQKDKYTIALESDVNKDKKFENKINEDDFIFQNDNNFDPDASEDAITGIFVLAQQFCDFAFPDVGTISDTKKMKANVFSSGFLKLKEELKTLSKNPEVVVNYIRAKQYSEKFVKILELSLQCDGPVFIFSNWLQFGVKTFEVLLSACGFTAFPKEGENRYFVWSSESSSDKNLTDKARNVFNSYENRDGSKLKIMLGTRSIMEGVSFKNVKQVHITDPWWNEARIDQIAARAIRFCSHSDLPVENQYTDIFRHISVLPLVGNKGDEDISEMLKKVTKKENYKNLNKITIEQKMIISSYKKYQINNDLNTILKEVAYDCNLNKNGNVVRLEEQIRPLKNGQYEIDYINPITLEPYIRDGIPNSISYEDVLSRTYSYPNNVNLPIVFKPVDLTPTGYTLYDDELLTEEKVNKSLIMYENINCWRSNDTVKTLLSIFAESNPEMSNYFDRIYKNFMLYKNFRVKMLGEQGDTTRYFTRDDQHYAEKSKLRKCLEKLKDTTDDKTLKATLTRMLSSSKEIEEKRKMIDTIIEKGILPTDSIPLLFNSSLKELQELIKQK